MNLNCYDLSAMPEATDGEKRAFWEGRAVGMRETLRLLYPNGIQNNDAIEELLRLLKSEKEGEE